MRHDWVPDRVPPFAHHPCRAILGGVIPSRTFRATSRWQRRSRRDTSCVSDTKESAQDLEASGVASPLGVKALEADAATRPAQHDARDDEVISLTDDWQEVGYEIDGTDQVAEQTDKGEANAEGGPA